MKTNYICMFFLIIILVPSVYANDIVFQGELCKNLKVLNNMLNESSKMWISDNKRNDKNIEIENYIKKNKFYNINDPQMTNTLCSLINTDYQNIRNHDEAIFVYQSGQIIKKLLFNNPKDGFRWINKNFIKFNDYGRSQIYMLLDSNYIQTWNIRFLLLDDITSRKLQWTRRRICDEAYFKMRSLINNRTHPLYDTLPDNSYLLLNLGVKRAKIIYSFKKWWLENKDEVLKDKIDLQGIEDTINELKHKIVSKIKLQKLKSSMNE